MSQIIILVAMTRGRVIGKDNKLPWHISEEIRNFKRLTTGNTVVMGRKTFDSIGKALPNRHNIVVSRSMSAHPDVRVCDNIEEALQAAQSFGRDIFIIGGAEIYRQTLARADKMYVSYVKADYAGDVYFPDFAESDWAVEEREDHAEYEFVVYGRKQQRLSSGGCEKS